MFSFKTLGTNSAPLKLQGLKALNRQTLGTNNVVSPNLKDVKTFLICRKNTKKMMEIT